MKTYYLLVWNLYGAYAPVFMTDDIQAAHQAAELLAVAYGCKRNGGGTEPDTCAQWATPETRPGDDVAGYITVIRPDDNEELLSALNNKMGIDASERRRQARVGGAR